MTERGFFENEDHGQDFSHLSARIPYFSQASKFSPTAILLQNYYFLSFFARTGKN